MGPMLSSSAWGCANDKEETQEFSPSKTEEVKPLDIEESNQSVTVLTGENIQSFEDLRKPKSLCQISLISDKPSVAEVNPLYKLFLDQVVETPEVTKAGTRTEAALLAEETETSSPAERTIPDSGLEPTDNQEEPGKESALSENSSVSFAFPPDLVSDPESQDLSNGTQPAPRLDDNQTTAAKNFLSSGNPQGISHRPSSQEENLGHSADIIEQSSNANSICRVVEVLDKHTDIETGRSGDIDFKKKHLSLQLGQIYKTVDQGEEETTQKMATEVAPAEDLQASPGISSPDEGLPLTEEGLSSPCMDKPETEKGLSSPCMDKPVAEESVAEDRLSSPDESSERAEDADAKGAEGLGNGGESGAAETRADADGKGSVIKAKKKEDKSIEYILRALSSLSSPEEKLAALCKKYADLHEEHRVLQTSFKQQQRKMMVVQREKDQLQAEHTKAVIAKSKLESLCRELQKQNKVVKEESLLRVKEEEERRKEISAKFQKTIEEIQVQMTENHEKNVKLREENLEMAGKLKKLLEQYEVREQQIDKMVKHRELENQLSEAKLAQAAAILKEEQERGLREKELILLQAAEGQKKTVILEAQLSMYKDRYEEFQSTINKSNDMFQKLKSEMDKMGKRIKKLEKEGAQWRAKWEASNKALVEMAEEKSRGDKEKQTLQIKVSKLESLCRALQGELHGKKGPTTPLPPAPTIPSSTPLGPACEEIPAIVKEEEAALLSATPIVNGLIPAAASASTTPPNTPEDGGSRASPSPDTCLAQPVPSPLPLTSDLNGPVALSADLAHSQEVVSEEGVETSQVAESVEVSPVAESVEASPVAEAVEASPVTGGDDGNVRTTFLPVSSSSCPDQNESPSSSGSSTDVFTTASDHSIA